MPTKIRPIVFKVNEPERFVMNASNATYTDNGSLVVVAWNGPAYPNGYNGDGKQYIFVNNNSETREVSNLQYGSSVNSGGPAAINSADLNTLGTSTGTLLNNGAGTSMGNYLLWYILNVTLEQAQAYIANISFTILDP